MRDFKIQQLSKITDKNLANKYFNDLIKEYPNHLPLLIEEVKRLSKIKVIKFFKINLIFNFFSLIQKKIMIKY